MPTKKPTNAGNEETEPSADAADKETTSYSYFTRSDGLYRAFKAACAVGLKDETKGPTAVQLAGALLGMEGLNEEFLPEQWRQFADAQPLVAKYLRRSVREMRSPHGEKFTLKLPATSSTLWVEINNHQYERGMPDPSVRKGTFKGTRRDKQAASKPARKLAATSEPKRPPKKTKTSPLTELGLSQSTSSGAELGRSGNAVKTQPDVAAQQ